MQSKGKPQPTAKKLPKIDLVPGTEHFMPREAVTTVGDQAAAEHHARESALTDIEQETGGKVVPIKGKAGKAKTKPKTKR